MLPLPICAFNTGIMFNPIANISPPNTSTGWMRTFDALSCNNPERQSRNAGNMKTPPTTANLLGRANECCFSIRSPLLNIAFSGLGFALQSNLYA
jgi:hypothetical protein